MGRRDMWLIVHEALSHTGSACRHPQSSQYLRCAEPRVRRGAEVRRAAALLLDIACFIEDAILRRINKISGAVGNRAWS